MSFFENVIFLLEREHISAVRDKKVWRFVVFLPLKINNKREIYQDKTY